ncbi:MalM family protein [Photobacterium iliopiscarium]|uniref:Transcriptional regulator n=1 Tax=Photobacterium iliopiscarium TaxID=56192 RepID=A0A2T3MRS0_9GAMM|nr:MalM family protein [Photobacterium iliopiscarium]PSV99937.1 transcriptional regulator [Photobacterium iliopiscarium]
MKVIKKRTVLVMALLSIMGCSNTDAVSTNTISPMINQAACCTSYSQFSWIPLQGADISVAINTQSQIGQFPDGKSYFAGFSLPGHVEQMQVTLESFIRGDHVFAPTVMLLNADFQPVKIIDLNKFSLTSSHLLQRAAYQRTFTMTAKNTPYMVVYSPEKYRGESITIPHPERVRAEELGLPRPIVTDPEIKYALTGQLHLAFKPTQLKSYQVSSPVLVPQGQTLIADSSVMPKTVTTVPVSAAVSTVDVSNRAMLPETEAFYNQQITSAIKHKNIKKALQLLNEAKRAGSTSAETVFVELVQ